MDIAKRFKNIKGIEWLGLIVDIAMIVLVLFDLIWLMFDALYSMGGVKQLVDHWFPAYRNIHNWFYVYDGLVVSIFIVELFVRWTIAIYRKTYGKWFFYPFAHWYDVLGCIPTGAFRILRLLRVVGMTLRLHKWGVIDLNNYYLYNVLLKYYNIVVEEIADRAVIKVLQGAKEEMQRGQPLTDAVAEDVLKPKKSELVAWTTQHIQRGVEANYAQRRQDIEDYIETIVDQAVSQNKEVKQLDRIPVLGGRIQTSLNSAISNIVFGVIDRLMLDLASGKNSQMIETLVETIFEVLIDQTEDPAEKSLPTEVILDTIELVINRIQIKKWKGRRT